MLGVCGLVCAIRPMVTAAASKSSAPRLNLQIFFFQTSHSGQKFVQLWCVFAHLFPP